MRTELIFVYQASTPSKFSRIPFTLASNIKSSLRTSACPKSAEYLPPRRFERSYRRVENTGMSSPKSLVSLGMSTNNIKLADSKLAWTKSIPSHFISKT